MINSLGLDNFAAKFTATLMVGVPLVANALGYSIPVLIFEVLMGYGYCGYLANESLKRELELKKGASNPDFLFKEIVSDGDLNLHEAAQQNDVGQMKFLLNRGADIEFRDEMGKNAFHYAVFGGHQEIINMLLDKDAEVSERVSKEDSEVQKAVNKGRQPIHTAVDRDGKQPIHYAAMGGQIEALEMLLGKGAQLDATDNAGKTPLHSAVLSGNVDMIANLKEKGADLNAQDKDGRTPLHMAVLLGQTAVVQKLLELGANRYILDKRGDEPYDVAKELGETQAQELLKG